MAVTAKAWAAKAKACAAMAAKAWVVHAKAMPWLPRLATVKACAAKVMPWLSRHVLPRQCHDCQGDEF